MFTYVIDIAVKSGYVSATCSSTSTASAAPTISIGLERFFS
jgi:hypothetical protein